VLPAQHDVILVTGGTNQETVRQEDVETVSFKPLIVFSTKSVKLTNITRFKIQLRHSPSIHVKLFQVSDGVFFEAQSEVIGACPRERMTAGRSRAKRDHSLAIYGIPTREQSSVVKMDGGAV